MLEAFSGDRLMGLPMRIDIVNFARNERPKILRWFIGEQLPAWIREMLRAKRDGDDPARIIDEFARVCCIDEQESTHEATANNED